MGRRKKRFHGQTSLGRARLKQKGDCYGISRGFQSGDSHNEPPTGGYSMQKYIQCTFTWTVQYGVSPRTHLLSYVLWLSLLVMSAKAKKWEGDFSLLNSVESNVPNQPLCYFVTSLSTPTSYWRSLSFLCQHDLVIAPSYPVKPQSRWCPRCFVELVNIYSLDYITWASSNQLRGLESKPEVFWRKKKLSLYPAAATPVQEFSRLPACSALICKFWTCLQSNKPIEPCQLFLLQSKPKLAPHTVGVNSSIIQSFKNSGILHISFPSVILWNLSWNLELG